MCADSKRFVRRYRLTKPSEFKHVFKHAERFSDDSFTILVRRSQSKYARLGMVVSNKNSKNAVRRNRIKRVIRESFRQHHDKLAGFDVVVISRPNTVYKTNRQLRATLNSFWTKAQ